MKYVFATLISTVVFLSGCATNIGFDPSKSDDLSWVEHNEDWKIASDYYHLKNKVSGITYTVYG